MKKIKQFFLLSFLGLNFFLTGCGGERVIYNADFFRADENDCWPCRIYDKAFFLNEEMNNLKGQLEKIDESLNKTNEEDNN